MKSIKRKLVALWVCVIALAVGAGTAAAQPDNGPSADPFALQQDAGTTDPGNGNGNGQANGQGNGQGNGNGSQQVDPVSGSQAAAAAADQNPSGQAQDNGQAQNTGQSQDNNGNGQADPSSNDQADPGTVSPPNDQTDPAATDPSNDLQAQDAADPTLSADQPADDTVATAADAPTDTSDAPLTTDQTVNNDQNAHATATSKQKKPKNDNKSQRDKKPGKNGSVTQTNDSSAEATAANTNDSTQTAEQDPGAPETGGFGPGNSQNSSSADNAAADQTVDNSQQADATAGSDQEQPSNSNVTIRLTSPGDDDPVSQTNSSSATAVALNGNDVNQGNGQGAAPAADQSASAAPTAVSDEQSATASATSTQTAPDNTNVSVRVFSPGDNGPVDQTNTSTALAVAANDPGGTDPAAPVAPGGTIADASATQTDPANLSVSVRVDSPGLDGPVTQENTVTESTISDPAADFTEGLTGPSVVDGSTAELPAIEVTPATDGGTHVQVTVQTDPNLANTTIAVVVDSPAIDEPTTTSENGTVWVWEFTLDATATPDSQTNLDPLANSIDGSSSSTNWVWNGSPDQSAAGDTAAAGLAPGTWTFDLNLTHGEANKTWNYDWTISCSCIWIWKWNLTLIGTDSAVFQGDAAAPQVETVQPEAPVDPATVAAPQDSGSVNQTNDSLAAALASNTNTTEQSVQQKEEVVTNQSVQAADQTSNTNQVANADASATQTEASNVNESGAAASQENAVLALAGAINTNDVTQTSEQTRTGDVPEMSQFTIQTVNAAQTADATASSIQSNAANEADGVVVQKNAAQTLAIAANDNTAVQDVTQDQSALYHHGSFLFGFLGNDGPKVQIAQQTIDVLQGGTATSTAEQKNAGANGGSYQADATAQSGVGNYNQSSQQAQQTQTAGVGAPQQTVQATNQYTLVDQSGNTAGATVATDGGRVSASSFSSNVQDSKTSQTITQYQQVGTVPTPAGGSGSGTGGGAGHGQPGHGHPGHVGDPGGGGYTPPPGGEPVEPPVVVVPGPTDGDGHGDGPAAGDDKGGESTVPTLGFGEVVQLTGLALGLILIAGAHGVSTPPPGSTSLKRGDAGGGGPGGIRSPLSSCACAGAGGSVSAGSAGGSSATFMTIIAFPDLDAPPPGRRLGVALAPPLASDYAATEERPG